MVERLTDECGNVTTFRLLSLLKDIDLNKDLNDQFLKEEKGEEINGINFSVKVFTHSIFDFKQSEQIVLPKELMICQKAFSDFYKSKHKHRILNWVNKRGEVTLETKFTKKPYTLIVN